MWLLILLLLAVVFIIIATTKLNLHPFLALLIAAFGYGIFCGKMSLEQVVELVNAGFGGTIGYIGIVILAGAVALSLGLYATHTMVPPTPGPVAAAGLPQGRPRPCSGRGPLRR